MDIRIPDSELGGTYAEGVRVEITPSVFTLDFIARDDMTSNDTAVVVRRVRIDPSSMQKALELLARRLNEYEDRFGAIDPPD